MYYNWIKVEYIRLLLTVPSFQAYGFFNFSIGALAFFRSCLISGGVSSSSASSSLDIFSSILPSFMKVIALGMVLSIRDRLIN
jgi:hypothetical protein